eukprot:1510528-Amphidinium_carterae.1
MACILSPNGSSISFGAVSWVSDIRTGEQIFVPHFAGQLHVHAGHAFHTQQDVYVKDATDFVYTRQVGSDSWLSQLPLQVASARTLPTSDVDIDVAELRIQRLRCSRRLLPRGGCSVLLHLHELYKQLQFETSKWPGTWTKAGFARWSKWLNTVMGLPLEHCRETIREADTEMEDKEKKSPVVSACGLVALLARWASPTAVGFRQRADRDRSRNFLHLLLSWLSDRLGEISVVYYDVSFNWKPPEVPRGQGLARKLRFSKGRVQKDNLPNCIVETMCQQTSAALGDEVGAAEALIAMASNTDAAIVLKCVVTQLGVVLDQALWDQCWSGETTQLSSVRQVQIANLKYVQASRKSMAGHQSFSLALDASRVGKRKVMLGVLSAGQAGMTCLMPPQLRSSSACIHMDFSCLDRSISPVWILVWPSIRSSQPRNWNSIVSEKLSSSHVQACVRDRNTEHELGITTSEELRDAFVERQRRWLGKRKLQDEHGPRGGAKKKIARKATLQLMKAVEHMLQQSSGKSLIDFMPTPPSAPSSWPHLAIS